MFQGEIIFSLEKMSSKYVNRKQYTLIATKYGYATWLNKTIENISFLMCDCPQIQEYWLCRCKVFNKQEMNSC